MMLPECAPANRRLCVLLFLALLPGKGVAQPGPLPSESIDLAVLNAQTVVVGKITSFEGEEGWQKQRTVSWPAYAPTCAT